MTIQALQVLVAIADSTALRPDGVMDFLVVAQAS